MDFTEVIVWEQKSHKDAFINYWNNVLNTSLRTGTGWMQPRKVIISHAELRQETIRTRWYVWWNLQRKAKELFLRKLMEHDDIREGIKQGQCDILHLWKMKIENIVWCERRCNEEGRERKYGQQVSQNYTISCRKYITCIKKISILVKTVGNSSWSYRHAFSSHDHFQRKQRWQGLTYLSLSISLSCNCSLKVAFVWEKVLCLWCC